MVGAFSDLWDPTGWALLAVFVPARLAGKWLAAIATLDRAGLELDPAERRLAILAPMGALPIAIVVNAELLYPDGTVPALVTAVLGAAVATEVLVHVTERRARA
jgi:hypothetical protein